VTATAESRPGGAAPWNAAFPAHLRRSILGPEVSPVQTVVGWHVEIEFDEDDPRPMRPCCCGYRMV